MGDASMVLRKEVLHRLILAKSILSPVRTTPRGQPNGHLVAKQVLNAHDASDLVFAAIADQQGKIPHKNNAPAMMQCLQIIDTTAEKHTGYFKQLNDARNSLKHVGNLPNTNQWANVAEDVFEKLSALCEITLDVSLDDLDESNLLLSEEAKAYLCSAKEARASQDLKLALEQIARALFVCLKAAPGMETIEVGRAKAEDALKLTAWGIPANDFLRLQEFLPFISDFPSEDSGESELLNVAWKQSGFGHPGNWREEVIDFCLGAFLVVALGIQNASPVPLAFPFDWLYQYRITAEYDETEVWEDLVTGHFSAKSKTTKRYMNKGESITVSVNTQELISDDFSDSGELVKRVRISEHSFGLFFGETERAEFVDFTRVRITCVPSALTRETERFSNLVEIPFQEDSYWP
jgi:hypothetical protein